MFILYQKRSLQENLKGHKSIRGPSRVQEFPCHSNHFIFSVCRELLDNTIWKIVYAVIRGSPYPPS